MRTSPAGIEAIKRFEGCVLRTYRCEAGKCTIGYGHTGPDVTEGMSWTAAQADAALVRDLTRFELAVEDAIARPMTQGQFDAMVSLAFNIGTEAFRSSTLVKRFNEGRVEDAAAQFVAWNKAGGAVSNNLLARRARELWMFARATP